MKTCIACKQGPMIPRRHYEAVVEEIDRQRRARIQLEELLAQERQIHATWLKKASGKSNGELCAR